MRTSECRMRNWDIPHFELHIPHLFEAPGGFEPPHKGFADLSLTTWVRRQLFLLFQYLSQFLSASSQNTHPPYHSCPPKAGAVRRHKNKKWENVQWENETTGDERSKID